MLFIFLVFKNATTLPVVSDLEWKKYFSVFHHRRPKLTIRGVDEIFMIYLRVSSET